MLRVLQFLNSISNPFVKFISQEQKFHCNSIYSYLVNPNINVAVEVKNTIRDLNLVWHNDVIRAKGRLTPSCTSLFEKLGEVPYETSVKKCVTVDVSHIIFWQ